MLFPANETTRQGVSLTTTGAKYFHTRYQIIIVKSNSLPSISENLSHQIKKGGREAYTLAVTQNAVETRLAEASVQSSTDKRLGSNSNYFLHLLLWRRVGTAL